MKILLVDKNLADPFHRTKWACLAARPGITLTAVTPNRWRENYRTQTFRSASTDGFPIVPLPVVWPGYENRGFYLSGLGGVVRREAPDILLAFEEPASLFAWQAVRAAERGGIPVVLHTWDNLGDGHRYAYRPARLYAALERYTMKRAALLFAANREARDRFAARHATPVVHLPFGIDLTAFTAGTAAPHADPPLIGYVGRLLPMKGIDTLLAASARMTAPHRLLLLGDGPDRGRLLDLASRLGLGDRFEHRDAVTPDEVPRRLAELSLLVLPSRTTPTWKEQFGRVLIEAMAAGVPVVGSSSGAIPEVIGGAGVVFPEGDVAALAAALDSLLADPARRHTLAEAGRDRAKNYSAERFAERVAEALLPITP